MLKVTFCIYDKPDNIGGPVTWVERLLPALRAHGIEARCLFLLHWGDNGPALSSLRAKGFDCRAVLAHDNTEDRIRWILDRLREDPPDVFVPNLVVAGYFAARWAREAGIPTVGVLHSDDEFYAGIVDDFVFGRNEFRLSAVVCVSRELERTLLKGGDAGPTVERIQYGVPVPAAIVEREPARFRIAYVGRLAEEQKRISDVTRALCRAVREIPGVEAVMFGDGPDRANVQRILAAEGGPVRLEGLVASEDIQRRLAGFDAIALLSDYEGLPIALMEAMACGCVPVCMQMKSGIPELVEHGVTGLLVGDRGDEFVQAVRRLRTDQALWGRLSRAARQLIVENFSDARSTALWSDLLHRLAASPGARASIANPLRLHLPPVHPSLAGADVRHKRAPAPVRLYRRGRMLAGEVRRRLLGGSAHPRPGRGPGPVD